MMNDDEHHNTFDDDPALDYIIYRELEKEIKHDGKGKGGGCLGLILLLILPACLLAVFK